MATYKVIRFYRDFDHPEHGRVIETGLTLEEAQAHCQRDDTEELDDEGVAVWFDGYTKEDE